MKTLHKKILNQKMNLNPIFISKFLLLAFLSIPFVSGIAFPSNGSQLQPEIDYSKGEISIPYAFYNENFGFAGGYVHSVSGFPQQQSTLLGTIMAGTKGSALGFLMGMDILLPRSERLFVDPILSIGYFSENESYIDGNPDFLDERAGSNDSNENNYVTGDGWDNFFRFRFKYLLPIGHGKNHIIRKYEIKDGLLEQEQALEHSWNPFLSGRTYLEVMPFFRSQEIDGDNINSKLKTNGVELGFFVDNRDFHPNPSKGTSYRFKLTRDFGWFDSTNSWTNASTEIDHYIPVELPGDLRQSVLAFNLWYSYSMSWDEVSPTQIDNRPPAFSGATLGGLWRLRGYPSNRFSDKAAVYYASELRMIPHWNPFDSWPNLQKHIGVEWLQFVPFVEIGRVGPSWDISDLHSDMKWSAGLGIRAWAKGIIVRIDTAVSEESIGIQMMVSQPFQF